jgi:TRAP-type mannitol/chloroaromatic compound transport system substrate-binding protein
MGAAVVFIPGGEVYEALQRGVIDACQLSSPAVDYSLGMNEVCDYIYLSGVRQPAEYHSFLFNTESWAALPDDLKVLVENCCLAEAIRYYMWMMEQDIEAVQKFKDYGCNVEPASQIIVDEIVRQAEIFYDEKAAEDPLYADVLESISNFQKNYRGAWARL